MGKRNDVGDRVRGHYDRVRMFGFKGFPVTLLIFLILTTLTLALPEETSIGLQDERGLRGSSNTLTFTTVINDVKEGNNNIFGGMAYICTNKKKRKRLVLLSRIQ